MAKLGVGSAAVLALLVAGDALAAPAVGEGIALSGHWEVSMDAQGKVLDLVPHHRLKPQVNARIEQAIRTWHFVPGSVNGVPAATRTELALDMTAVPTTNGTVDIRIDDARLGGRQISSELPVMPQRLIAKRPNGMVVLRLDYAADGKVVKAEPEPGAPQALPELTEYFLKAARSWTFEPERVEGHAIAGSVVMPLCMATALSLPGQRPRPPSGPPCRWTPPGAQRALAEGQALALAPVAQLASDVIGKTL